MKMAIARTFCFTIRYQESGRYYVVTLVYKDTLIIFPISEKSLSVQEHSSPTILTTKWKPGKNIGVWWTVAHQVSQYRKMVRKELIPKKKKQQNVIHFTIKHILHFRSNFMLIFQLKNQEFIYKAIFFFFPVKIFTMIHSFKGSKNFTYSL